MSLLQVWPVDSWDLPQYPFLEHPHTQAATIPGFPNTGLPTRPGEGESELTVLTGNTSRSMLRASEDLTSRQGAGEEGEKREDEGEPRGGRRWGRVGEGGSLGVRERKERTSRSPIFGVSSSFAHHPWRGGEGGEEGDRGG